MDRLEAPADPAQRPGQLDVQPQPIDGRFTSGRLFDLIDHRLDLGQGAREPRREAIGEKAERTMPFGAIPARNPGAGRVHPLISAMAGKGTTAVRMQRATLQGCNSPGLLVNVFRAGEPRCESKLHRPWARTALTVAGLLLCQETPSAMMSVLIRSLQTVARARRIATDLFPTTPPFHPVRRRHNTPRNCRWLAND